MKALKEMVVVFLGQLSAEDRDICRQIMEGNSLRAIARTRGCPYSTLKNHFYKHVIPVFIRELGGMK